MLYHKLVAYDQLRAFGCLCFAFTLLKGTKFVSRAKRTILVGNSETQKGYKLFGLISDACMMSRDMVFREDIVFLLRECREKMRMCLECIYPPSSCPPSQISMFFRQTSSSEFQTPLSDFASTGYGITTDSDNIQDDNVEVTNV